MRPVLVIIEQVGRHQPFEMPLIQDDHVVQQVASATSHPALRNTVLPRTAKGRASWLASHRESDLGSTAHSRRTAQAGFRSLVNHTENQGADLFADTLPSPYLSDAGDPRPIQTKPGAMPVHDGSRSDQDERLGPPGPERSQRNPEQFVQGSQSTARLLRVQSQQLPTESQVLEDEVLPGTESVYQPTEEMSERHDHRTNYIG